jgi:hypothetical protein
MCHLHFESRLIDFAEIRLLFFSQPTVLDRASEVMVSVINVLGLSEGFETLTVRSDQNFNCYYLLIRH